MNLLTRFLFLALTALHSPAFGETFDITSFGATADDDTDDTTAIENALEACREAGGGTVSVPKGVFLLSRRDNETPILEIPSDTTFTGTGPSSTLKFTDAANQGNFWRMIGSPAKASVSNIVIKDLHLDGGNTFPEYIKGETPEHNAGIWFYNKDHSIENVLIENVFAENFAGDCIAVSRGCKAITIRNCTLRNFIRQGIQMGGDENARDYLVTGCRDLEHTVKPGGSTIHVEHARGLKNVIIENNQCRKSILAGGVDGMIIRGNTIEGRLVGNGNTNLIVESNVIRAKTKATSIVQFGYCKALTIRGNQISSDSVENSKGIYVWGTSRYNDQPGEDVIISQNRIQVESIGISLNGTKNVVISDNILTLGENAKPLEVKRSEGLVEDVTSTER